MSINLIFRIGSVFASSNAYYGSFSFVASTALIRTCECDLQTFYFQMLLEPFKCDDSIKLSTVGHETARDNILWEIHLLVISHAFIFWTAININFLPLYYLLFAEITETLGAPNERVGKHSAEKAFNRFNLPLQESVSVVHQLFHIICRKHHRLLLFWCNRKLSHIN